MKFNVVHPCDNTVWVKYPELGPDAEIEVTFAGEENEGYLSGMLRLASRRVRKKPKKKGNTELSVEDTFTALIDDRDDDRKLYPNHVIRGWRGLRGKVNPQDTEVVDIPYTPEAAAELCQQLTPHLMDRMRTKASNVALFVPDYEEEPDPDELAKN